MREPNLLIVDDDPSILSSLQLLFSRRGYRVLKAKNPEEALARVAEADLVVQDMNFSRSTSGEEGLILLTQLLERRKLPVILLTAWGSIGLAVKGIKAGAFDFLSKPWDNEHMLKIVSTALSLYGSNAEPQLPTRDELDKRGSFKAIVGEHPRLLRILDTIARVSRTDAPVLILGESGTGKELLAEAIHYNSPRQKQPFIKVNLGGMPHSLFESEMFGHVRGAFTDAVRDRVGRFGMAQGGSLFLDEIGDLERASQVKLLRVLQDRKYEKLGDSRSQPLDLRIVSATNRPLDQMVQEESFREDLLYRINLITLEVPALRERSTDIPLLARHFLDQLANSYQLRSIELPPETEHVLCAWSWPGNIRELRQTIERAVILHQPQRLLPQHLNLQDAPSLESVPSEMTLDELEVLVIKKALETTGHNISKVAERLGLSRAAVYRRMEKYGLR
ncbi:MAG: sigma-54-dependent Fis family transcriptional regulator [Acidobacteria bacterium]|nr:sigma-54-dependent Fis family transcriptional regulator [Acidobacteriota bacterium]MCB9397928.1 sigma-54-dependent Fis family transcriptional regulator [Acidobacteriota bacterium]